MDCTAADDDLDGFVDMDEAFPGHKLMTAYYPGTEQPQYYENPTGFGTQLYLGGYFGGGTGVNITGPFASNNKADRITVEWSASDTSTLAGFNIYRAVPGNAERFEKINTQSHRRHFPLPL